MTLDELKAMDKDVITPAIAAQFLGCNPYNISITARDCPERLGFPVSRVGSRTKIPRLAFIRFLETGGPQFEKAPMSVRLHLTGTQKEG